VQATINLENTLNSQRYRVYEGVGVPPPNPGPRSKWGDLPLETIKVGDLIELPLSEEEVKEKLGGVRAYAGRIARQTGKKYSVRVTSHGIDIYRVS
jgi:hypothetical protein